MSESPFELFRVLPSVEEAEALGQLLEAEGIGYQVEKVHGGWHSERAGVVNPNSRMLMIAPERFGDANSLLELHAAQQDVVVDEDHYLNDFNDQELVQIVAQKHEWSTHDYLAAIKLLDQRGVATDPEQIAHLQEENLRQMRKPKTVDEATLGRVAMIAFFGGPVGLMQGYFYWQSKKTDPTGERYFEYDSSTRGRGRFIFYAGLVSTSAWIILFLLWRFF